MLKRMILMLAGDARRRRALGFVKFQQIQTAMAQGAAFQPPPEAVTTIVARQEEWPATLGAIGTVAAVQGVTVSADLPGIVERIAFDSGKRGARGRRARAARHAAGAGAAGRRRGAARAGAPELRADEGPAERTRRLAGRVRPRGAEQKQTEARVGEIRATIERKTIRAPFSGVLGIRQVNLGQYLAGGDPLVPLQSLDPIYVNFGVPQQDAGQMRLGRERARHRRRRDGAEFAGRVTAIDSVVDEATRNVQVQATLANPGGKLRPGMFVQTEVSLGAGAPVIALPASAISYAPLRRLGVRRQRPEGSEDGKTLSRRAAAVRQARRRARRSGRDRLRRQARRRSRDVRRVQAAQRRGRVRSTTSAAGEQTRAPEAEDS